MITMDASSSASAEVPSAPSDSVHCMILADDYRCEISEILMQKDKQMQKLQELAAKKEKGLRKKLKMKDELIDRLNKEVADMKHHMNKLSQELNRKHEDIISLHEELMKAKRRMKQKDQKYDAFREEVDDMVMEMHEDVILKDEEIESLKEKLESRNRMLEMIAKTVAEEDDEDCDMSERNDNSNSLMK